MLSQLRQKRLTKRLRGMLAESRPTFTFMDADGYGDFKRAHKGGLAAWALLTMEDETRLK
jgi:hypothetical protein